MHGERIQLTFSIGFWLLLGGFFVVCGSSVERRELRAEICGEILCSFEHLEVDTGNDKLYVGAVNSIYQLDEDLHIERKAKTGPVLDSDECHARPPPECTQEKTLTNNLNKLLKIDSDGHRIVACGSVKQGICDLRSLGNVSHVLNDFSKMAADRRSNDFVASTSPDQTTVAFIAKEGNNGSQKSLFIGSSRTIKDVNIITDEDQFPTFSSRRMPLNNMDSTMLSADLNLNEAARLVTSKELSNQGFRVNFISAFEGTGNGYFVSSYHDIESGMVRKDKIHSYVAQVCMRTGDDRPTTNSYFEIPISSLSWLGGRETYLTRVIASATAKVGNSLSLSLNVPIPPQSGNPDVLFASFATEGEHAGGSILAMFPLHELDDLYYTIVQSCLNGYEMNHIKWHHESKLPCKRIDFPIRKPLCSNEMWDVVGLLQSNVTLHGYTVFESNDTVVTSVAIIEQGEHTVVFMGTKKGHLLKLKVDSKPSGNRLLKPYEDIEIDSHSSNFIWKNLGDPKILPDMRVDNRKTRLYVMSERRLVSLPLHDCSKFKTCFDCLDAGDPFCGWCTLDNKCTASSQCRKGQYSYQTSHPDNCPKMGDVFPPALAVKSRPVQIEVEISNIPNHRGQGRYTCVYGGTRTSTLATYRSTHISCMSPPKDKVPELRGQEVSVPLSLYYTRDGQGVNIASTEIVFYDCNNFKSCLACLSSPEFECHWCSNDNECLQKDVPCKTYQGNLKDNERCPRLLRVMEPSHIPYNKKKSVKLQIKNLNAIIGSQTKFSCRFSIDGMKPRIVNATQKPSESAILCDAQQGFLPSDAYEAKAKVDLYWKKNFLIDNPDSLNVTMYRCSRGASDNCGKCLQLSKGLACGWCERDQKCSLCDDCAARCSNDTNGVYEGWLDDASICMNPEITDFHPKSAAPGGVTKVTIEGINFGKLFKEGRQQLKISVANKTCTVLEEGFKESEKVICEVRGVTRKTEGPVELCILNYDGECKGSKYTAISSQIFEFEVPVLTKFDPSQGLDAGGAVITFTGQYFNIGNGVTVRIGNRQCHVLQDTLKNQSFKCKLACDNAARRLRRHLQHHQHQHHHSRHYYLHHRRNGHRLHRRKRSATGAKVKLIFDRKEHVYPDVFRLEDDIPRNIKLDRKESIKSGGMKLTLLGNNLHLTQSLVLEVSFEGQSASKTCESPGDNKNSRVCYSPAITGYPTGNYSATLKFDDCLNIGIGNIRYTDDPWLEMFHGEDHTRLQQSGSIIINGRNLCPNPNSCDKSSAKVMIGDEMECNLTDLYKDKLVCAPPPDAGGKHEVEVSIGGYTQTIGKLEFESGIPQFVYALVAIFVIVVIGAIVVACVVHKRADKKVEQVKQKQMEYDQMEAKVAKECKEAFAELQVDMRSDLENMGTVGIPFRPRNEYIMKVLFPEPEMYEKLRNQALSSPYVMDHPRFNVHNGRGAPQRALSAALDDFDKLLEDKNFLLIFINTLEKQKRFSMKDRSNVAGLLMIVLQNRLQYATSILEHLLSELIREVMESKSNPKLLLRRSESVAEKMLTHWFSILLHGFLQECAGEPLFTLYRAIRAQLDKGPVDAVTGFAKYSLNQDKLLRQAISYEQLVLIVRDSEDPRGNELHVRVLDCDTITQTKEKIIALKFRNGPQSSHPSPDAFDLEMNTDVLGQAILSDEDNTSIVEGGWKRLNTLLHYKVKDMSTVTMVPKKDKTTSRQNPLNQSTNSNYSFGSRIGGMRHNGSGHRLINDGSLPRHVTTGQGSRSSTPTQGDDGKRPYHIMKQHDNEPHDGAGAGSMMVSEIYLTRLLATKGTIQKFVDDLFETIFSVVQRGHALPLAIKHMFDFFDEQAEYFGITDPDVVHTWKSNSLPLRFWVNLIKNPEFLFDIKKTALVDSCLSVIAGTFMDSCSTTDQNLGKDSATGKLLYAKDVQNYKRWVANYYDEISGMEHLSPKDMQIFLQDESRSYSRSNAFSNAALTELYFYVQKYNTEILNALDNAPIARSKRLAQRLQQVATTMTSTV